MIGVNVSCLRSQDQLPPFRSPGFHGWGNMATQLKSNQWSCETLARGMSYLGHQQENVKIENASIDEQLAVLWWNLNVKKQSCCIQRLIEKSCTASDARKGLM